MPLKVPAIRFKQKKVVMYLTVLPVNELGICSIDRWDPQRNDRFKGYQRGLIRSKINKISKYLEREDGILPVAGMLNVREKGKVKFDCSKNNSTLGLLTIDDYTRLYVVDMQHRIEGIKLAHSKGYLKEFSVPVLITEGLNNVKEAAQFYIINTQAKKMGVDLTRRLLIEHDEIKDLTDVKPWELKAVQISIYLNKQIKNNNPWYKKIKEPESDGSKSHIATEKSFVPSLKWLLNSPGIKNKSAKQIASFLSMMWEGLRFNMPEAFDTPKSYLIQKTPGFMAFHRLAPIIYRKTKGKYNSVRKFEKYFKVFATDHEFNANFWYRGNLKGAKKYGTGQSAYTNLAMDLAEKLGIKNG